MIGGTKQFFLKYIIAKKTKDKEWIFLDDLKMLVVCPLD
jgi:hypothetical protein